MPESITTSNPAQYIVPVPHNELATSPNPVPKTGNDMSGGKEQRKETPPSETRFEKMLQEKLAMSNQSVNISVDDVTKRIVVKIVDNETNTVVRQLPTEEMLRISRSLMENSSTTGNLTDVRI